MTVLRSTVLIDAPVPTVAAALRHVPSARNGLRSLGVRGRAGETAGELLVPGDEMTFRLGPGPSLRTRIVDAGPSGMSSVLIAGCLAELRHDSVLAEIGRRTLVTDSVRWRAPLGVLGRVADVLLLRRFVLAVLARRLATVRAMAESWALRPVVVATALVRGERVLGQQRGYPARDAGRWELPGGRVEAGETENDAVIRECEEELDVSVVPTGRVGTDVPLSNGMLLRTHTAELADPAAEPKSLEHRAVRWISRAELADVDWLDADRLLLPALRDLL